MDGFWAKQRQRFKILYILVTMMKINNKIIQVA